MLTCEVLGSSNDKMGVVSMHVEFLGYYRYTHKLVHCENIDIGS